MKFSFLIFSAVLLSSSALKAAVIYNNLTGTPSASVTNGQPLNDVGAAVAFTPTGNSYFLNSVQFTASLFDLSSTNSVTVSVETDAGGLPSGTVLESFTLTNKMGVLGVTPNLLDAVSVVDPVLFQNYQYWVVLTETSGSGPGDLVWNYNNSTPNTYGLTAVYQYNNFDQAYEWVSQGTTNYLAGALLVTGTIDPIPEPGTLLTLASGLAAVVAVKRRRA